MTLEEFPRLSAALAYPRLIHDLLHIAANSPASPAQVAREITFSTLSEAQLAVAVQAAGLPQEAGLWGQAWPRAMPTFPTDPLPVAELVAAIATARVNRAASMLSASSLIHFAEENPTEITLTERGAVVLGRLGREAINAIQGGEGRRPGKGWVELQVLFPDAAALDPESYQTCVDFLIDEGLAMYSFSLAGTPDFFSALMGMQVGHSRVYVNASAVIYGLASASTATTYLLPVAQLMGAPDTSIINLLLPLIIAFIAGRIRLEAWEMNMLEDAILLRDSDVRGRDPRVKEVLKRYKMRRVDPEIPKQNRLTKNEWKTHARATLEELRRKRVVRIQGKRLTITV